MDFFLNISYWTACQCENTKNNKLYYLILINVVVLVCGYNNRDFVYMTRDAPPKNEHNFAVPKERDIMFKILPKT